MEENDVLDDLNDQQPELPHHRQRCFRFLFYSLGISVVMVGQIWLASSRGAGDDMSVLTKLGPIFSLGIVGVWLFAGLGSLAAIRAINQERPDLLLVTALTLHILALGLSTGYLYQMLFMG